MEYFGCSASQFAYQPASGNRTDSERVRVVRDIPTSFQLGLAFAYTVYHTNCSRHSERIFGLQAWPVDQRPNDIVPNVAFSRGLGRLVFPIIHKISRSIDV